KPLPKGADMSQLRTLLLPSVLFLLAGGAAAQPDAAPGKDLLARAQNLAGQKPSAAHWGGLAEMSRALKRAETAAEDLARAVAVETDSGWRPALLAVSCCRLLPLKRAEVDRFRQQIAVLRERGRDSRWLAVYQLYLANLERDRAALL